MLGHEMAIFKSTFASAPSPNNVGIIRQKVNVMWEKVGCQNSKNVISGKMVKRYHGYDDDIRRNIHTIFGAFL